MSEISFRIANNCDHDLILNFLRSDFYQYEPLTIAHPITGHTEDDEEFTMAHLSYGTTIMALDAENGELVGVLISGPLRTGESCKEIEKAKFRKWFDISRLLAYIELKAKVCEAFDVIETLHIHAIAVKSTYRGSKIGQKLFKECFKLAKEKKFTVVSVDCTSVQSARIADNLNMQLVSEVTYEEYNKIIISNFFQIIPPNYGIKTFAKKID